MDAAELLTHLDFISDAIGLHKLTVRVKIGDLEYDIEPSDIYSTPEHLIFEGKDHTEAFIIESGE